jgi:hypothetical protein
LAWPPTFITGQLEHYWQSLPIDPSKVVVWHFSTQDHSSKLTRQRAPG